MFLFVDTANEGFIKTALCDGNRIVSKKNLRVENKYSEMILTIVDQLMAKKKNSLSAVFVVSGPGRFSALRSGVTVANILGWSLNIPVVGLKGVKDEQSYWQNVQKTIIQRIKKTKGKKFTNFITPQYGQSPNITIKKVAT
jgi:tRNA A37 threonylcarbamoyladenosine modification protein TsaB